MKSFANFIKNLFDSSSERIKNPVISSIFYAWIIANWDAVLTVLFHNDDMLSRIMIAKSITGWEDGIVIPFGAAGFYIFALPYLQNWTEKKLTGIKEKRFSRVTTDEEKFYKEKKNVAKAKRQYDLAATGASDMEDLKLRNEETENELKVALENLNDYKQMAEKTQSENADLQSNYNSLKNFLNNINRNVIKTGLLKKINLDYIKYLEDDMKAYEKNDYLKKIIHEFEEPYSVHGLRKEWKDLLEVYNDYITLNEHNKVALTERGKNLHKAFSTRFLR